MRYAKADELELYSCTTLPVKRRHQPCRGFTLNHALSEDEHKHNPARMRYSKFVHYVQNYRQTPHISRALSLRNLVSGYECGRVFSAGVGPGSPLRDAANWLPSRFGLSVETRRQYGWLRMVFSGVRLFRAPIWWPSGGWRRARGREHCRGGPGSSLSGGYAPDSAKAEGSSIVDEPREG